MNHCIGIPAAELTIVTDEPVMAVATAPRLAMLPPLVPRMPVFLRSLIQSVYVFTGRMKYRVSVRLQGAQCPFLFGVEQWR